MLRQDGPYHVATDAGREGELIFRYIYQHLGCRKPFDRLWISSLTDKAIREGLSNLKPGNYYDNLYHSAKEEAKLTGSWVSMQVVRCPLPAKGGYSLGRVQTPTLAMVCRRYIENRDFFFRALLETLRSHGERGRVAESHWHYRL